MGVGVVDLNFEPTPFKVESSLLSGKARKELNLLESIRSQYLAWGEESIVIVGSFLKQDSEIEPISRIEDYSLCHLQGTHTISLQAMSNKDHMILAWRL